MYYTKPTEECQRENQKINKRGRRENIVVPPEWERVIKSAEASPLMKRLTYYKYRNTKICKALKSIGETAKAVVIKDCGTYAQTTKRNGHDVFAYANFCRERMCTVCGWRRSSKFVAQMLPVVKLLSGKGFFFVFVTLTIPNIPASGVRDGVNELLKGWDRLNKKTAYKKAWCGFVRSVETTYNMKTNTYHPHIHALIAVEGKYFREIEAADKSRKAEKIMNEIELKLSEDWKSALKNPEYEKLTYPLQVSMLPANRMKRKSDSVSAAAAVETLKYALKINSEAISPETISAFYFGLANKRLISFGGVVAKARLELQQKELDDEMMVFDESDIEVDSEAANVAKTTWLFSMNGWKIIEE